MGEVVYMWRSEDRFVESVFSFHFDMGSDSGHKAHIIEWQMPLATEPSFLPNDT